ncbi:hypothetical protein SAMN04488057_102486 [Cyclobacterium lianum]|uniref:DoxX-like family protein n=2 Tax=Cyclobacterium lianum TaxID=388280 RepID=A0A1M7KIC1_9BACT|nr:hypothetical protein SAMN04488057_102486 [Cyclobacterium lianum]
MPHRGLLLLSGIYALLWGAFFRWFGPAVLGWLAMETSVPADTGTLIYGSIGMAAGLLLFLSAFYPISWIYLMGIGMLGKIISLLSFLSLYLGALGWNKRVAFHLLFNEAIWLIPLAIILWRALKVKKFLKTQS